MSYIINISFLLFTVVLRTHANGSCSNAPWTNLGGPSFGEGELEKFGAGTGIYQAASWPMPKNFFRSDWDPALVKYEAGKLSLAIEKRADGRLMGAEIRTNRHFGYGCVSACMKPIKESGVISSLFTYTGKWDGYNGIEAKHNEIDIEFEGKNTNVVQFNYYTNNTSFSQNNEFDYPLGFDAAESFNVYGFRWTPVGIEWEVNGKVVKTVGRDVAIKPPTATIDALQKVLANAWVVSADIGGWFGGQFDASSFTKKSAEYQWIRYQKLDNHGRCRIASSCW